MNATTAYASSTTLDSDVLYTGPCHPICDKCHGPNAMDCDTCVENAEFGKTNECSCSLNWDGLDCTTWVGDR